MEACAGTWFVEEIEGSALRGMVGPNALQQRFGESWAAFDVFVPEVGREFLEGVRC